MVATPGVTSTNFRKNRDGVLGISPPEEHVFCAAGGGMPRCQVRVCQDVRLGAMLRSRFRAGDGVDTLILVAREPSTPVTRIGSYRVIRTLAKSAAVDGLLATPSALSAPSAAGHTFVVRLTSEKYAGDEAFAKAVARAASAYGRLTHPAIVQLRELVQFEGRP